MITAEKIQACNKEDLPELIPTLEGSDISQLVTWLSEQEDNFRYKCFLLLQGRSQIAADVYPYWDEFVGKLTSPNSYQRSLGLMLIAENARWDQAGKFDAITAVYLSHCDDEKPVTVRQCIQGLNRIVPYNQTCHGPIVDKLITIDLMQRKETQRKILLMDILGVLCTIQNIHRDERIDEYLLHAISGAILDNKSKRAIEAMFAL